MYKIKKKIFIEIIIKVFILQGKKVNTVEYQMKVILLEIINLHYLI